ncbi:hypothetical protein Y1Q_0001937 [Alligator mississippiensis]|uniref:Uncharacterized protein n=1 Tax=Alligator mississippiensis TaxID=8496 RepID=A0A151PGL0_ALLMI|nr:hypothetical protein Y1Q_0001937 [Alligator mississippiensis]
MEEGDLKLKTVTVVASKKEVKKELKSGNEDLETDGEWMKVEKKRRKKWESYIRLTTDHWEEAEVFVARPD